MNFILTMLGGKFGVVIAVVLAAVFAAMAAAIGVLWYLNGSLTDDLVLAKAREQVAIVANQQWAQEAGRINGKVEDLIAREAQSTAEITAALLKVTKGTAALLASAKDIASRPLPASPAEDCTVTEAEIRAFLRERRTK